MSSHSGSSSRECTGVALPVSASTCAACAPAQLPAQCTTSNPADCRVALPAQNAERTAQSLRAEASYRDWSEAPLTERPLVASRSAHAAALFGVLKDHGVSILRFAEMLGVNERQARKYLEASSPIPSTLLDALPNDMADNFAARLRALRGGGPKSAADKLRAALSAVERDGASSDLLLESMGRLGALSARARGGR